MVSLSYGWMAAVDILVVCASIYLGLRIYKNRNNELNPRLSLDQRLFFLGLSFLTAFYLIDLLTLWLVPHPAGEYPTMTARDSLHFLFNWFVVPLALGAIGYGILCLHDKHNQAVRKIGEGEDKLAEIAKQVALANNDKSKFLTTMSHKFRTPLNTVLGFSEMMRTQYFGPLGSDNYRDYVNAIHKSGELILALVDDILNIVAIEAGDYSTRHENIDLDELLRTCVRNFEYEANRAGIGLTLEVEADLPPLSADRRSATQIVLNALSNAIKFTDRDGEIAISVSAADQQIAIKVRDSGIGISPEQLASVTEPFFQVNSSPGVIQNGTGLGLYIAKSLVEVHDGELDIESEVGRGTTVTISFPVQGHAPVDIGRPGVI